MFRAWKTEISKYRRKGRKDNFEIKRSTKVCDFHFPPHQIRITLGHGKKKLDKDAVPSIYSFKCGEALLPPPRRSPSKRLSPPEKKSRLQNQSIDTVTAFDINSEDEAPTLECMNCTEFKTEIKI
jgi:hypothetical protein